MKKKAKIIYIARCKGIQWMGPFGTALRAWQAVMTPEGVPAEGAIVWPEEVPISMSVKETEEQKIGRGKKP